MLERADGQPATYWEIAEKKGRARGQGQIGQGGQGGRAVQRSQLTVIANIDLSPPSAAAYRSWAIVPDWFVLRML